MKNFMGIITAGVIAMACCVNGQCVGTMEASQCIQMGGSPATTCSSCGNSYDANTGYSPRNTSPRGAGMDWSRQPIGNGWGTK
jgi:hypothetical protein